MVLHQKAWQAEIKDQRRAHGGPEIALSWLRRGNRAHNLL